MRNGAFDMVLRRSEIALGPPVPNVDDHLAWADLCVAEGLTESARLLYATAFLRRGFAAQHRVSGAALARRIGWDAFATDAPEASARFAGGTVDIAVAEIVALAQCIGDRVALNGSASDGAPAGDAGRAAGPLGDLGEAIHQLCAFLRSPVATQPDAADALLARLGAAARIAPHFDYRIFHAAPLPLLAEAMAFAGLHEFLLANHDLMFGSAGSAALLHATARFDIAGLGPYLANVGRIASKGRDLFALADIAVEAGGGARDREPWVVLLAHRLTGPLLTEVVDDLGDRGAIPALEAIFDRARSWPDDRIDLPLVLQLRDAALDNGDYAFAARAQARIVRARPAETLERVILGSIEATAGMIAAAEQTFLACLARHPGYGDLPERLIALRTRDFARFEVRSGYGSPAGRALFRRHRSQGSSLSATLRRKHPVAVEL